ncbi:MAG: CFI-box-CTERM domain-containing protein [Bacteroidota bacterium]
MIEIQEIFQWCKDKPTMPSNLTSIQKEEWENEKKKVFKGEKLIKCQAMIGDVSEKTLHGFLPYKDEFLYNHFGNSFRGETHYAISYEIDYDKNIFLDTVKSIYKNEMIEFDGIVKYVKFIPNQLNISNVFSPGQLQIQLELTTIKKIENVNFVSEILGKNHPHTLPKKKSGCFIATACYGDYNSPEVLVLREYRDKILLNTSTGRTIVQFYYLLSPFIARLIEKSDYLRSIIRKYILNPIVSVIQHKQQ